MILDSHGQKVLDVKGQVDYEVIDDALREIFDLLPRSESIELKRLSWSNAKPQKTLSIWLNLFFINKNFLFNKKILN